MTKREHGPWEDGKLLGGAGVYSRRARRGKRWGWQSGQGPKRSYADKFRLDPQSNEMSKDLTGKAREVGCLLSQPHPVCSKSHPLCLQVPVILPTSLPLHWLTLTPRHHYSFSAILGRSIHWPPCGLVLTELARGIFLKIHFWFNSLGVQGAYSAWSQINQDLFYGSAYGLSRWMFLYLWKECLFCSCWLAQSINSIAVN